MAAHMTRGLVVLAALAGSLQAEPGPSYPDQIQPILNRYCVECHQARKARGGLSLGSYQDLRQGGDSGAAVAPGRPDASRLLMTMEGRQEPVMPPKKKPRPRPDEIALIRAWVAAGARGDAVVGAPPPPAVQPPPALSGEARGKLAELERELHREREKIVRKMRATQARTGKEQQKKLAELRKELAKKQQEFQRKQQQILRRAGAGDDD